MSAFIWIGDRFLNLNWIRQIQVDEETGELTIVWSDGDLLILSGAMAVGLFRDLKERCAAKNRALDVVTDPKFESPDWFYELWGSSQYPGPVDLGDDILDEFEF
ncbi:hypothetical protein [Limnothrix redekei]|uniref:DUF2442 domain-containing protein n=1 Tax=Limnothrix redekei LRLZ20PSL1 TaxID=3112953 RepID=A0ABW7CDG6_9CYAN